MKREQVRLLAAEKLVHFHDAFSTAETAKILAEMLRQNKSLKQEQQ